MSQHDFEAIGYVSFDYSGSGHSLWFLYGKPIINEYETPKQLIYSGSYKLIFQKNVPVNVPLPKETIIDHERRWYTLGLVLHEVKKVVKKYDSVNCDTAYDGTTTYITKRY